jgi:hypothetical protein
MARESIVSEKIDVKAFASIFQPSFILLEKQTREIFSEA